MHVCIIYIYIYCVYIDIYMYMGFGMLLLLQYPIVTSCYFGFCGYLRQAGLDGSWAEPAMGHHHLITVVRGSALCCLKGKQTYPRDLSSFFSYWNCRFRYDSGMTDFWTQALTVDEWLLIQRFHQITWHGGWTSWGERSIKHNLFEQLGGYDPSQVSWNHHH